MVATERLHLTLDDQIADRYLRVPFEIGHGTASVEILLDYDTSGGVLDLGCEGPAGWRGWSGGARRRVVIAADEATPGYLPGELETGWWHVVLGLHKVPAAGLEATVEIRMPAQGPADVERRAAPPSATARGSERGLPAPAELRWFAGDFHAHTVHSDGSESIRELAARGVRSGLDFIAVTDHNTVSHHPPLPRAGAAQGISLIPGQEVTTARGHANAFGDIGWIDFRRPAQTWVGEVTGRGGVLSVNHPVDGDCSWQHPLHVLPAALELWHVSWFRDLTATSPWAFWQRWDQGATPLGGSDFHAPEQGWTLGTPTTWVAAEDPSTEAILAGVRAGRTAISIGVGPGQTPRPLSAPVLLHLDGEVLAIDAAGTVLVDADGRRRRITSDHQTIPESWGRGPLHLQDADRRLLAISPTGGHA
jgi:hypothetical protein